MRFQLLISCNNEAFGEDQSSRTYEVDRILTAMRSAMFDTEAGPGVEHTVRDLNGNTVGTWAFIEEGREGVECGNPDCGHATQEECDRNR